MLDRTHQPARYTPMAGRRAGQQAARALEGAARAIQQATEAFEDAPTSDHRRDALVALKRIQRELSEATACAKHLRR